MAKNFKSNKAYKSWLAYGHASGEFAKTPGNQKVSIKGKPKKVKHAYGGPYGNPPKKRIKVGGTSIAIPNINSNLSYAAIPAAWVGSLVQGMANKKNKFEESPKGIIKQNPRKVTASYGYGGPKYPSGPYYPYKGSTLRVDKSYDKNHVQPSVFSNGGELVTIGDKTYNTASKEYKKLVESGKVKPYSTDTESGIGAFDYGNLPDFEVTAPTQEAVDMAKRIASLNPKEVSKEIHDVAKSYVDNEKVISRKPLSVFRDLLPYDCYDNTCVELLNNASEDAGYPLPKGINNNIQLRKYFKSSPNYRQIHNDSAKAGDFLQYYDSITNKPYHAGIIDTDSSYISSGGGSPYLPFGLPVEKRGLDSYNSLDGVPVNDEYYGFKKDPHYTYRYIGNNQKKYGGAVNSYDKGGHIHPHPENPPVKKQRTWEEEQALGDAYMLSKEQNAAALKALQEEQIRVKGVRENAYNIASNLSKSKNPEDSLVGIKPTNAGNFCNAYSNSVYCQAGATTVEDINFPNYWGKGKDRFIPAGSKHPQIAGNLAEQGKLDEEGFVPISLDKIKKGDRLKKEMYVKRVPWQKSGSTNPSWKPGHAAIYGGVDEKGNPIALDSNGSPLNFSERGWHYPWDSRGDTSTYNPESDSGVDIRTKAYRYVGNTPSLQETVTNTPILEKPTRTAKAPTKPIQKLENLNNMPNIKLNPEQAAQQYFSNNTIPSFKYGGCVGKKYKNGGSCGCSKCGSVKYPHGGEVHPATPLTWDPRTNNQGYQGIMSNDIVPLNPNTPPAGPIGNTNILDTPPNANLKNKGGFETRNVAPTFNTGGYMKYADGGTILLPNEMPNVNSLSVPPLSEQIMGLSPEAIGDVPPINPSPATAKVGASSIPNDFAFPGKFYNAENLTKWREQMTKDFTNPTTKRKYTEIDPAVSDSLQTLFSNTGYKEDSNIFKDKEGKKFDNPYAKVAWSAATTSNAVMNLFNQDKEGIKKLGFRPAISHSNYITDALLASKDSDYKYNLYNAEPISNTELGVGDILFRGRNATKDWTFEDFQNNAEKNKDSTKKGKYKGYDSHSDIITDKGEDDKGNYYLITGGNLSNTFKNKKVYYNPETGKLKNSNYKGVMRLREEARPQELVPMQNIPMQNIPTENMRKDILNPMEISRNSLASILPNNQFNMGGYMKYANGAELETDPPFTKEQFQTAMGSADMSLGVKPLNRSEQYQYYTGKPYKGDRTSFDKGMTALATTGIGAAFGAGKMALNYKNKYMPQYRRQYDEYIADMNAMGSSWGDPNKQDSFDEYLDFYESAQGDFKKEKTRDIGIGAIMGGVPGLLANFVVNKGLDKVRMHKNRKHREALENAKNLGEATDKEILEFRNQQKHGGYMQYANGGQFDTGGQMGEFSGVPVTEFNNGGSHEANPLGGIPQGPGALVEEGELKLDLPSGEQFIVSPKIMYKKNDKEVAAIAQELGISEKEFKRFAGKDMVSVFKSLTRKNSFNGEKREGDAIQENSIEADIMPFVELHTFLTERKNAEEAAKKEQAFAQDMDMMMQEHPEYMQAMMAQQQQQQGPSPEEQAMMEQQMMQQQGGAPQGMPPMMGTYGGKMNPDGSVIHFNNGGYSYSDYLAPQQAMPVQGVAASGYGQGGMMLKQYKYGAGLGIASDVLGGAASVVGNIPGIGTALGAGLGTLAGTAGYLSDNAAASEDGKVSDIDPAQLALEAGKGAGSGALGFAGATAVNLGGAAVDQFTDSKEDEKNAKTALILQDPTHPEHEEAKARELEKQKALKGTGAIGAGIGLASNIIGGKVDAKNAAGVADADFLESGANLADWAPENTTTAIDATTGLASSMAPPQMAQGGYMQYMNGGVMKYTDGGKIGDTTDPNWFSNLTQQEINALMSGAPYIIAKDGKKYNNPNPDPNTWASTIKSDPMMAQFANNNFNNYNTNIQDLPKGDVEKQDSVLDLQNNPLSQKVIDKIQNIEDFDSDAAEEAELDAQTEAEMFADAPTVRGNLNYLKYLKNKQEGLKYENPDTLKYNTRETNYLKPTFLENVLAASPGIANIGMGLSKADKLKLDRVDPISAKYINLDESRKANERLLAAQQAATKNVAGNAGGGNYLANMQATYLKYLQGMSGIDQQEKNVNAQIGNQTAAQNARIAAQNAQLGFREQDYDARTKAAKQNMIGTGIGQIADVYQGNRQNKFLAENYFPLVAPNYSDYYKYETKAGAKRRAKKNS
jgi:hypothetical protein